MIDDLNELWDVAIYKEIASQALYTASQKHTDNPAVVALLKELVDEETNHVNILKSLKENGLKDSQYYKKEIRDLKMDEYLTAGGAVDGSSLQDIMVVAINREQQSVEFYSHMLPNLNTPDAKKLCEMLIGQELKHKVKLEKMYDDLYYQED